MLREDFERLYNELVNKNIHSLEDARSIMKEQSKKHTKIAIIGVLAVVFFMLLTTLIPQAPQIVRTIFIILLFVLFLLIPYLVNKKNTNVNTVDNEDRDVYEETFNSRILNPLIKHLNENLEHTPQLGIEPEIFSQTQPDMFDNYNSCNLVQGNLSGSSTIKLAYFIASKRTYRYSPKPYSHSHYSNVTIFKGMLVDIELSTLYENNLYLRKKGISSKTFCKRFSIPQIKLQNSSKEFEDLFDIYATNEMLTHQLLSQSLIQTFFKYYNEWHINYEITIKNNHIYIAVPCKENIFAPIPYTYKEDLFRNYQILNFIIELSNSLVESINAISNT